jgi:type II secretion system protein J
MSKRGGFTLLEVLMALGVFAIAVVGMMVALNAVLESAQDARLQQIVRQRLENHLAFLEAGPIKEVNRKVDLDSPKMTITETVRREQVHNANRTVLEGFWRVEVVAEWEIGGVKQKDQASILRFAP